MGEDRLHRVKDQVGEWRKAVGGLELRAVLCNRLLRRRGGDWNRFGKAMEEDLEEEEEEEEEEGATSRTHATTWPLGANVVSFEPTKFGSDYTLCDTVRVCHCVTECVALPLCASRSISCKIIARMRFKFLAAPFQ